MYQFVIYGLSLLTLFKILWQYYEIKICCHVKFYNFLTKFRHYLEFTSIFRIRDIMEYMSINYIFVFLNTI